MYFDTHCHLDDERFAPDRDALIAGLPGKGITRLLWPGTDIPSSQMACQYAKKYSFIQAAAGVHPHEAKIGLKALLALEPLWQQASAVGEIGLDYHYDFTPRPLQREVFAYQLEQAARRNLPVILHEREAAQDFMDILCQYKGRVRGVMHSCAASREDAARLLDAGFYLSFNGLITFAKVKHPLELVAFCPRDRLLLETDSPFMTPVPHRGQRNDPSLLPLICQKVADIWGVSREACAEITFANGEKCFPA